MPSLTESPWFISNKLNPKAQSRLFCFSYAGGGPQVFRNWTQRLAPLAEVWMLQLPGRANRLKEPPYLSIEPLVEDLSHAFRDWLDKPFEFFGHSFGALVCFELAHRLADQYGIEPALLIVSGRTAPQIPDPDPPTYNLPDDMLIKELHRLNGTPREVLDHPELMELMLPIIRADFQAVQTYQFTRKAPLHCAITALGGLGDTEVSRPSLEAWGEHTDGPFAVRMLPGDHFFIHSAETTVIELVYRHLYEAFEGMSLTAR